jgi:hypothetical protein
MLIVQGDILDIVKKISYILDEEIEEMRDDRLMAFIRSQLYLTNNMVQKEDVWKMVTGEFKNVKREQFEKIWVILLDNSFLVRKNKEGNFFEWSK